MDIVFIKDFATKKAGDSWDGIDGFLGRQLIDGDKVAVLKKDYKPKKTANKSK